MDYVEKCLKNYLNDSFTMEEVLFLFSYFIAKGIAWNFTNEIRQTAEDFIQERWIDEYGNILIDSKEADSLIYYLDEKL